MKRNTLFRTLCSVTGLVILTKLLGFVKQMVVASSFGTTIETDIINLSQNLIYNLQYPLAQALLTAFVSIYIYAIANDEHEGKRFAMDTLKVFSVIGVGLSALVFLAAPLIARILAPTYSQELSSSLSWHLRLFSPLILFYIWKSVFISLLNSNNRFIPSELTGVFQSILQISIVLLLQRQFGVKTLNISFLVYTVWNVVFLGILTKKYFHSSQGNPLQNPNVRKLLRMTGPLLLGHSMVYINQMVDQSLVSGLSQGTLTALNYALVLYNMVTTFIMMFCAVLFTHITTCISREDHEGAAKLTLRSVSLLSLIFLPVTIIAVLCAEDVVTITFGRGAFGAESITASARALMGYCLSFVPLIFRELFARFQYGYQDSRQPMINSSVGIAVNIALSIILCPHLGVWGITFATTVSIVICGVLNMASAKRHNRFLSFKSLLWQIPFLVVGSILCALLVSWGKTFFAPQAPLVRFILITLCSGCAYLLAVSPLLWKLLRNSIHY